MNILFVIDTYQTNNNGTSISAQRYAQQLRQRGHEVRIVCADENPAEDTYMLQEKHYYPFDNLIHKHGFRFAQPDEAIIREAVEWADIVHCFMPFQPTAFRHLSILRKVQILWKLLTFLPVLGRMEQYGYFYPPDLYRMDRLHLHR